MHLAEDKTFKLEWADCHDIRYVCTSLIDITSFTHVDLHL